MAKSRKGRKAPSRSQSNRRTPRPPVPDTTPATSSTAAPTEPIEKHAIRGQDPRPFLSGRAPGFWASNHLEETREIKNWPFVVIRTLCRMATRAELQVTTAHDLMLERDALQKRIRKARKLSDTMLKAAKVERLEARLDAVQAKISKLAKTEASEAAAKAYRAGRVYKAGPAATSVKPQAEPVREDDAVLKLLHRPCPDWSWQTFIFQIVQQLSSTGTAYLWSVTNGVGVPLELYIVPTGLLVPRPPTAQFPEGSYWLTPLASFGITMDGGSQWQTSALGRAMMTGTEIDARDIKPIRWPHPLYLTDGLSPQEALALWVDLANAMDAATYYDFQNSEKPGMVFRKLVEPNEPDMAQFREDLRAEHAGIPNTGKHLILPVGIEAEPRARTGEEIDYVGSRPQVRDMILAGHGVTPIACGIAEAGTQSGYWTSVKQTCDLSLQPLLDLIGGELTEALGSRFDGPKREIKLYAPAIDDPQLLESRLATDISAGNVLLVSEYRALRGLPPFGDERDDMFVGAQAAEAQAEVSGADMTGGGGPSDTQADAKEEVGNQDPDENGAGFREPMRDKPAGSFDPTTRKMPTILNGHLVNGTPKKKRRQLIVKVVQQPALPVQQPVLPVSVRKHIELTHDPETGRLMGVDVEETR